MIKDEHTQRYMGIVAPIAIVLGVLHAASDGKVEFRNRGGVLTLTGFDLLLFVAAALGAALLIHAAWFWANTRHDAVYAQVGQVVGLLVIVAAIGLLVVRQFQDFL